MANHVESELEAVGIPFFGTRPELLSSERGGESSSNGQNSMSNVPLSSHQLKKFQTKMLELLEDLCKE